MQQGKPRNPTSSKFSVEILTEEGLWAQHGPPSSNAKLQQAQRNVHWRRWGVRSACAALTVCLHLLLLSSMLLGTAARPHVPPQSDGAAASAKNAEAREFVSTMILLNSRSITDPETQEDSVEDVLSKEIDKSLQKDVVIAQLGSVSQPEISGAEDGMDPNAPSMEAAGDDEGRAMLFGRYMEQIKARIQRAWDQPAALVSGKFQCRVEIVQGAHGEVQQVTLQRCNGNSVWQLSLVQAIQRASPLPAPPSEKVFTSALTLSFEAVPQPGTVDVSNNNVVPLIASSVER